MGDGPVALHLFEQSLKIGITEQVMSNQQLHRHLSLLTMAHDEAKQVGAPTSVLDSLKVVFSESAKLFYDINLLIYIYVRVLELRRKLPALSKECLPRDPGHTHGSCLKTLSMSEFGHFVLCVFFLSLNLKLPNLHLVVPFVVC